MAASFRQGPVAKPPTGHNDPQCQPRKSPGYFMIANRLEERNFYLCLDSYCYVEYEEQKKRGLARTFQMESFVLPPFSLFAVNGYMQRAGAEYLGRPNFRSHDFFVCKDIKLPNAIWAQLWR